MKLLLAEIFYHYNAFDETDSLAAENRLKQIIIKKTTTHQTKKTPKPGCLIVM